MFVPVAVMRNCLRQQLCPGGLRAGCSAADVLALPATDEPDIDDFLDLLVDLHVEGPRQAPGDDDETRRVIDLSGLRDAAGLMIADVGCGYYVAR